MTAEKVAEALKALVEASSRMPDATLVAEEPLSEWWFNVAVPALDDARAALAEFSGSGGEESESNQHDGNQGLDEWVKKR